MRWVLYYYPHFPENMQLKLREVKSSSQGHTARRRLCIGLNVPPGLLLSSRSYIWHSVHAQSCPTLCNHMGCTPPDLHGMSQARMLEQVAISFSRGSSSLRDVTCISFSQSFLSSLPPSLLFFLSPYSFHSFPVTPFF